MLEIVSYAIGKSAGYKEGYDAGQGIIEITSGITCTDDGNGNITITEDEQNG